MITVTTEHLWETDVMSKDIIYVGGLHVWHIFCTNYIMWIVRINVDMDVGFSVDFLLIGFMVYYNIENISVGKGSHI